MSFENNKPGIVNENVNGLRDICARRAATISNMIDEAKKRGLDDEFARQAIATYGADNGKELYNSMKDPESFEEFEENFGTDHNKDIYEMEVVEKTKDKLAIDFHYCPYVTEWVKQGRSKEEIATLCQVAMEGDHAFAKQFPNIKFELGDTIADGACVCQLRFYNLKK